MAEEGVGDVAVTLKFSECSISWGGGECTEGNRR